MVRMKLQFIVNMMDLGAMMPTLKLAWVIFRKWFIDIINLTIKSYFVKLNLHQLQVEKDLREYTGQRWPFTGNYTKLLLSSPKSKIQVQNLKSKVQRKGTGADADTIILLQATTHLIPIQWWKKTIYDLPWPSLTFQDLQWPSMTFYHLLRTSMTF